MREIIVENIPSFGPRDFDFGPEWQYAQESAFYYIYENRVNGSLRLVNKFTGKVANEPRVLSEGTLKDIMEKG
jgi:hypothetical protein